jgi:hypothetical protein
MLIRTRKHYKVRLLVREPTWRERFLYALGFTAFRQPVATMVREYSAYSAAEALEAARVELGHPRSVIGKTLFVEEL